jgi:hypothetical protein
MRAVGAAGEVDEQREVGGGDFSGACRSWSRWARLPPFTGGAGTCTSPLSCIDRVVPGVIDRAWTDWVKAPV